MNTTSSTAMHMPNPCHRTGRRRSIAHRVWNALIHATARILRALLNRLPDTATPTVRQPCACGAGTEHPPFTTTTQPRTEPIAGTAEERLVAALNDLICTHAGIAGYPLRHESLWATAPRNLEDLTAVIDAAASITGRLYTIDIIAESTRVFRDLTAEQEPGRALSLYATSLALLARQHRREHHALGADIALLQRSIAALSHAAPFSAAPPHH